MATWEDGTLGDWHYIAFEHSSASAQPLAASQQPVNLYELISSTFQSRIYTNKPYNNRNVPGNWAYMTREPDNSLYNVGILESCWMVLDTSLAATVEFFIEGGYDGMGAGAYTTLVEQRVAVTMEEESADGYNVLFAAKGTGQNSFYDRTEAHVYWDVTEYNGRRVRFRIYDTHTSQYIAMDEMRVPSKGCIGAVRSRA